MTEINNECDGSKYIFSLFPFTILMQIDVFASHECMIHFQSSFFAIETSKINDRKATTPWFVTI